MGRGIMAGRPYALVLAEVDRARRNLGRVLDALGWSPVQTPSRTVLNGDVFQLKAYQDRETARPLMLMVPAPIKQAYIWDLLPPVSVVSLCLRSGMGVYMVHWKRPDAEQQALGLEEYAGRIVLDCVDAIASETSQQRVTLAGHSLGGTLAGLFAALHPQRVNALVLLETPLHFGPDIGDFGPMAAQAPPASAITQTLGNVPGAFLDAVAMATSPETFGWSRIVDGLASLSDPRAWRTHLLVERWTLDETPLPRRLFEQMVEWLYREDRFVQGRLRLGGRQVAASGVAAPTLVVADPRSRIVPPAAIVPFLEAASSSDKRLLWYHGDTGVCLQHVGVLVGRNAHREIWPRIVRWLGTPAKQ